MRRLLVLLFAALAATPESALAGARGGGLDPHRPRLPLRPDSLRRQGLRRMPSNGADPKGKSACSGAVPHGPGTSSRRPRPCRDPDALLGNDSPGGGRKVQVTYGQAALLLRRRALTGADPVPERRGVRRPLLVADARWFARATPQRDRSPLLDTADGPGAESASTASARSRGRRGRLERGYPAPRAASAPGCRCRSPVAPAGSRAGCRSPRVGRPRTKTLYPAKFPSE